MRLPTLITSPTFCYIVLLFYTINLDRSIQSNKKVVKNILTKQDSCYILLLNKKLIKRKGGKKLLDIQTSNSIVANRVKEIISKKGLKQTFVAEKAGFTPQEFSDMLNGRRLMRAIDIASIINALAVVGVTANDLFSNYAAGKGGE